MKNILITFLLFSLFFCSCSNEKKIFKGEIIVVEKPATDKLSGKKIELDGLYAGYPIVFDSIISFVYPYGDYFVSNFDLNTGKHIGNFFNKGQGPDDFLDFSPLDFVHNFDYWIHEFNKRHFVLVDMSSGITKKRVDFSGYNKKGHFPFARVFIMNDSLLLAINQPETKNLDYDVIAPKFRLINYLTNEEIADYDMYDEDLYNKIRGPGKESVHLDGGYKIKPDKSKVVCIMRRIFQINLLDLKTGELKGYRIDSASGWEFARVPLPVSDRTYNTYLFSSVDDCYIYSMLNNSSEPDIKPEIHVFDWNGNFIRILEFDQKGSVFNLDSVRKKLYFKDSEVEENVWVYDVSYLYE